MIRSDLSESIYELLAREVAKQEDEERRKTMTSSGVPHYLVPRSMSTEKMACCSIQLPCPIHSLYFGPDRKPHDISCLCCLTVERCNYCFGSASKRERCTNGRCQECCRKTCIHAAQ